MVPTSGRASATNASDPVGPPRLRYIRPVTAIVIASAAALNTVRYSGYGCLTLTVHWVMTPATAMTRASRGPSSSSAIKSAAYDTDNVEPLASAIGSVTFQVDITQATTSSVA